MSSHPEHSGATVRGLVECCDTPFRYFLARQCLAPHTEKSLLKWFESHAPWKLVVADFYEQFQFCMSDTSVPQNISHLVSSDNLTKLRLEMEQLFHVSFDDQINLVAHKLVPGQRIAIHNDFLKGEETHRLIVQINHGLRDEDGGFFILFNTEDPKDIHRIFRPIARSGIGFEICENSNHAVSQLYGGVRYTLVYSLYAYRYEL